MKTRIAWIFGIMATAFTICLLAEPILVTAATQYTLSVSINPAAAYDAGCRWTGAGTYDAGTVVKISATEVSGWQFNYWTGDDVASAIEAETTITMDGNKTITADFSQIFSTDELPVVETAPATSVGNTSATLNGNLISMGIFATVDVSFEYGTLTGVDQSTTTAQTKTAAGTFSADITGLTPGTTYAYFAVAEVVSADTFYDVSSEPMTFTTSGGPPAAVSSSSPAPAVSIHSSAPAANMAAIAGKYINKKDPRSYLILKEDGTCELVTIDSLPASLPPATGTWELGGSMDDEMASAPPEVLAFYSGVLEPGGTVVRWSFKGSGYDISTECEYKDNQIIDFTKYMFTGDAGDVDVYVKQVTMTIPTAGSNFAWLTDFISGTPIYVLVLIGFGVLIVLLLLIYAFRR